MNMTEQFGLSPNISKKRLHQFSYIGAAMLLMQLDQGAQTKKVCRSKKCTQKSTSDPPAVSAKTLQKLIQSDGEDDSEDSCTDLPALTELSDDDSPSDEDSNCENHDDRISYISRRRGEQTAAASSARWKKTTQLERARKSGRIAPTDFRPPTKRRKTDAQRQVHVAVERMKTAAEEYHQSAADLYKHIIGGTTYKLLADQSDDSCVHDFSSGQLNRVCKQAFAVADIYTELSQLVLQSAACLESKSSISQFFLSEDGLYFEKRRDDIYQSISKKYGSKKEKFTTRTHRAYVWETQYRQTGHFNRDRRGTAQVGIEHMLTQILFLT